MDDYTMKKSKKMKRRIPGGTPDTTPEAWTDATSNRTPEQMRLDGQVAAWRKNWQKAQYCYPEDKTDFPPPLYDAHVMEWQEGIERSKEVQLTKEIAEKHKAELLGELIKHWEEEKKRWEETKKMLREKYGYNW